MTTPFNVNNLAVIGWQTEKVAWDIAQVMDPMHTNLNATLNRIYNVVVRLVVVCGLSHEVK